MKVRWSKNDDLFISELAKGHYWEQYVAAKLIEKGFVVQVPRKSLRKAISEADKYTDEVDVYIGWWDSKPYKIEVKSRRVSFDSPDDFPFDDILVTTKKSWEQTMIKPAAFLVVSQITGAIIATSSSRWDEWEEMQSYDQVRGINDVFLTAHRDAWRTLDEFCEVLYETFAAEGQARFEHGETP